MSNCDAIVLACNSIFIVDIYDLLCLKFAPVPVSRLFYTVALNPQTTLFTKSSILYTTCGTHKGQKNRYSKIFKFHALDAKVI